ncbi:MAG: hypothetical protein IPN76_17585 [Saprospiraceae bacterium]|nr:hypothetical protein [Saprospiraceae bacterium]
MGKRNGYEFTFNEERIWFEFDSLGPKGRIRKIVEFYDVKFAFNLAFGDMAADGEFDDENITDNGDIRAVIQTIANIIHHFCESHPGRKIYIEPVDSKRKALYNRIFKEKFEEIEPEFRVFGIDLGPLASEDYRSTKTYDAFLIEKIV